MDEDAAEIGVTDLRGIFEVTGQSTERIGVEVEMAALDPETGLAVRYDGRCGVKRILETILEEGDSNPILDEDVLVGVERPDGTRFGLEPSGALEYSSIPYPSLTRLMEATESELQGLATRAARLSIALVPGGNYPFNDISNVNWTPNHRISIMSDYFSSVGKMGAHGHEVMGLTLSTQATLDYVSAYDLSNKLRMQVAVSPVAAALFVNSPMEAGRPTGMQSRRMHYWFRHSPRRTGILPPGLSDSPCVDEFVEWAAGLPMIYRKMGKGYAAAPDKPFSELLRDGFGDGTKPGWSDWVMHLSQIWTDVRLRRTLELRAFDGPPRAFIAAVPAFWTGLSYSASSCDAAWQVAGRRTMAEYYATMRDIALRGIRASFGSIPVLEVARELVRLAREGLIGRINDGLESRHVLQYLEPLDEVLDSRVTFADACLERWQRDFHRRPDLYVRAFRI